MSRVRWLLGVGALAASGGWFAGRALGGSEPHAPARTSERSDELARLERIVARWDAERRERERPLSEPRERSTEEPLDTELLGESAAEVLARLEREYRASRERDDSARSSPEPSSLLAHADTVPRDAPPRDDSADAEYGDDPRETSRRDAALERSASSAPSTSARSARPRAEDADAPQAVAAWTPPAPETSPVPGSASPANVQQTNVVQIHNETHLNQVSMVTQYQQLLLIAPSLLGASPPVPSGGGSPAQRRPGPSSRDGNPWASTDYGSHYANPWGSPFGRRP